MTRIGLRPRGWVRFHGRRRPSAHRVRRRVQRDVFLLDRGGSPRMVRNLSEYLPPVVGHAVKVHVLERAAHLHTVTCTGTTPPTSPHVQRPPSLGGASKAGRRALSALSAGSVDCSRRGANRRGTLWGNDDQDATTNSTRTASRPRRP